MYTAFVSDCKTAMSGLWASVEKIHAQQTRNDNDFRDAIAEERNAKLEADKKAAVAAAKEKINAIMDKATEDAAPLDTLTPLDVEPSEKNYRRIMELLSGRFDLSVENLNHLISEYIRDNRAMLNAVSVYCQNHGLRLIRATSESRRSGIESIRASALSVVSKIEATNYKNNGRELDVSLFVRGFCSDSDAAPELCQHLGQRFDGTLVSPIVTKAEPFDFSFQRVRDAEQKAG